MRYARIAERRAVRYRGVRLNENAVLAAVLYKQHIRFCNVRQNLIYRRLYAAAAENVLKVVAQEVGHAYSARLARRAGVLKGAPHLAVFRKTALFGAVLP